MLRSFSSALGGGGRGIVQMRAIAQRHKRQQRPVIFRRRIRILVGDTMFDFRAPVARPSGVSSAPFCGPGSARPSRAARGPRDSPCMVEIDDQHNGIVFRLGSHRGRSCDHAGREKGKGKARVAGDLREGGLKLCTPSLTRKFCSDRGRCRYDQLSRGGRCRVKGI